MSKQAKHTNNRSNRNSQSKVNLLNGVKNLKIILKWRSDFNQYTKIIYITWILKIIPPGKQKQKIIDVELEIIRRNIINRTYN